MENNNQNQNEQQDNNKIAKQYEANLSKLAAILGGKENIYPTKKVEGAVLDTVIEELLKEQKEKVAKEVKTGLQELLDKKVQFDKDVKAKEEELKKLKEAKQKEFNESCSKIFGKISNIEQLQKDYEATLGQAGKDDVK